MAYLTKKDLKWDLERDSVAGVEYSAVENSITPTISIAQNKSLVSNNSSTPRSKPKSLTRYHLPSLASAAQQEVREIQVVRVGGQPLQQHDGMDRLYGQREQDRKVRREIANSNERRRMQSINAGFKSLKAILPQTAGDKLSKAAILQQTAEYIFQLDDEKTRLFSQNEKLRTALLECKCESSKLRALFHDGFEKDSGIGSPPQEDLEDIRRDFMELRHQLDKERRLRMRLQEKVRDLESPTKLREITQNVQEKRRQVNKKSSYVETARNPGTGVAKVELKPVSTQQTFAAGTVQPQTNVSHALSSISSFPSSLANVGTCIAADTQNYSPSIQVKCSGSLPRSSQPLKKRAIEISPENECFSPKNKLPKVQTLSIATTDVAGATVTKPVIASPSIQQKNTVFLRKPPGCTPTESFQRGLPVTLQSTNVAHLQERILQPSGMLATATTDNPVLLSTNAPAQAYITLTPSVLPQQTSWPDTNTTLAAVPSYSVSVAPLNSTLPSVHSHYVLQPAMRRVSTNPEEITLNQLNSAPSLSMTLTQLNALPAVARLNPNIPTGNPVLPSTRVQTQYLPVVPMDTVLSRQGERRISLPTADNALSDEDRRERTDDHTRSEHAKVPAAIGRRTKSEPAPSLHEMPEKLPTADGLKPANHPSTSLSNGPGSPPAISHIDAGTMRRNLETIVQAIDHLEQQERRNSQDQQTNEV